MKINIQKRIGEVVIVTEGDNPEFEIIKGIFHDFLEYNIILKKRNNKDIVEFQGHDVDSRIILLNAPTNNINSLQDINEFYDFLYNEVSKKFDLDLINDATYIIFDRDRKNNRYGVVKKLINVFTESQNDSEEQNGLLLLSYPSIEAFQISMFEDNSFNNTFGLGNEAKEYVKAKAYELNCFNEDTIKHSTNEFLKYLFKEKIINCENEVVYCMGDIGQAILEKQTKKMQKNQVYNCVSQLVQILLDLGIVELD